VPDHLIEELPATSLPADWRSIFPSASTRRLGNNWLASRSRVGLLVPSILITGAAAEVKNCLINPEHPDFDQVTLSGPMLLALDSKVQTVDNRTFRRKRYLTRKTKMVGYSLFAMQGEHWTVSRKWFDESGQKPASSQQTICLEARRLKNSGFFVSLFFPVIEQYFTFLIEVAGVLGVDQKTVSYDLKIPQIH
jgi:hypothetical protein